MADSLQPMDRALRGCVGNLRNRLTLKCRGGGRRRIAIGRALLAARNRETGSAGDGAILRAMVPLGDPRDTTAPFAIDCPAHDAARWIDSRNWSYDFDHDLSTGVQCSFKLRVGLKSLAGKAFTDLRAFNFDTGGPSIVDQRPWADARSADTIVKCDSCDREAMDQ